MTKGTMRAARFDRASRRLIVQDVPVPQPGAGEVVVRVEACGICLSDVHMIEGTFPPPSLEQVTPGHEAAGTIEQVGPAVPLWRPGQRVERARQLCIATAGATRCNCGKGERREILR